jgi:hypothetical protein
MALTTYQDVWRDLLLLAPDLPPPIAMRAVNTAYHRILDSFRWSGLRGEAEFYIPTGITTGTADVVQGSNLVTGPAGQGWTAAVIGRQFFTNGVSPYYTITAWETNGATDTLTLDRVWGTDSATGQTYTIQLVYLTPVSDFLQFVDIRDITNNWRWVGLTTVEYLDKIDAQRSYSGTSYVLAAVPPASNGAIPRYEIYPRPPAGTPASYPYRYLKRPPEFSAPGDLPIYPIRMETVRYGALVEIAKWPGTAARPNPYFNLDIFSTNEAAFQDALGRDNRIDQEINQTDFSYEPVSTSTPYFPWNANFLQNHLVTRY